MLKDRRRTIEAIAELSGITWSSVQQILSEELGMKRVAAKFMPRIHVYEWFSRFKKGQMSIDDKPRSGRPSTS